MTEIDNKFLAESLVTIKKFSKFYEEAIIKLVTILNGESFRIFSGTIDFTPKGRKEEDELHDYGVIQLHKMILTVEEAIRFINDLIDSSQVRFKGQTQKIDGSLSGMKYKPSQIRIGDIRSDFPIWYSEYRINNGLSLPGEILIAKNAPMYPDGRKAVADFLETTENPSQRILIQIPDYRARISELKLSKNIVNVEVETKFIEISELSCRIYAEQETRGSIYEGYEYNRMYSPELNFEDNKAIYEFEGEFNSITAVIYEETNLEIIDTKQYNYSWLSAEGISIETPELDVYELIRRGETLTTEFKIDIGEEFLETVVAFANTVGGIILLGVADDGQVKGFKPKTESQIENLINSNLDPIPYFTLSETKLEDKPVTIIKIKEGDDKPYSHRQKGVYVRSTGSDLRGTRTDWERFYRDKKESDYSYKMYRY